MEDMKLVIFQLGNERYGVDIDIVKAIEKVQNIVRIPNSVPYIKGIINLRGDIIPVCSLRNKFGMEESNNTDSTKFLIIAVGDMEVAFLVDALEGIFDIPAKQFHNPPPIICGPSTGYIHSIAAVDEKLVVALDTNNILSKEEQESLEKIVKEQEEK